MTDVPREPPPQRKGERTSATPRPVPVVGQDVKPSAGEPNTPVPRLWL